jgi:ABC-type molybdate transport system ATPase subunit
MYSLALIIFVVYEKKAFEHFPIRSNVTYGENVSKRFFSETTWTIETKLPRNDHWKVLHKVSVLYADRKIIFVVYEKKAFEHFPIRSNVNLCSAMAAILDFRSA